MTKSNFYEKLLRQYETNFPKELSGKGGLEKFHLWEKELDSIEAQAEERYGDNYFNSRPLEIKHFLDKIRETRGIDAEKIEEFERIKEELGFPPSNSARINENIRILTKRRKKFKVRLF